MIPDLTPAEIERFYSKIRVDGCGMLWDGPVNNHGYGRFEIYRDGKRVRVLAHRLTFKLATGEDPADGKLRHGCDNPPCVTPDCLEPGTQADNIRDAVERGRTNTTGLDAFREARSAKVPARLAAGEKPCSICKKTLPLSEFYRSRNKPDGRDCACVPCRRTQKQQRQQEEAVGKDEYERRQLRRNMLRAQRKKVA